jgi:23S rRNA (adenine-N6)-dimethyltransferase
MVFNHLVLVRLLSFLIRIERGVFFMPDRRKNPPVWVSQNFLTSKKTIHRLISKTSINPCDHVIEIGPGKGHITRILMQYCQKLSAVEKDKGLYDRLLAKYGACDKLSLHNMDFMKWSLPASREYKVFANIPFCHTTAIIKKLTEFKNPPKEAWLIMEKGAAKRFLGKPSENIHSLSLKPIFDLSIVYYFSREDFRPMPKVDVVMVHIKSKPKRDISAAQWKFYQKFIASGLGESTGLSRLFTKRQLNTACKIAGVSDLVSGEILYIQWLCLFRCCCMKTRTVE